MSRIWLVHWHAREAAEYAAALCDAGHEVTPFSDSRAGDALKRVRHHPPEAFVLVLDRLPSHGRAVAQWLRENKSTRPVPLVFVGGDAAKVEPIRKLLPDATYSTWTRLEKDLEKAIRNPPSAPARPGMLAGYSGTPLVGKLGIKSSSAAADLEKRFAPATRALAPGGRLWIAWRKKASGIRTDLGETHVRAFGLQHGLVDYKICAIDALWSGLCFARRAAK